MMLLIVLALFFQDPSPVPGLLDRVNDKDPVAAFKAISDLADLGPEHHAEIRKGAEKLPAFYRDALLAELAIPAASVPRVTLPSAERTGAEYFAELKKHAGMEFKVIERDRKPKVFALEFDRTPILLAVGKICESDVRFPRLDPMTGVIDVDHGSRVRAAAGARSSLVYYLGCSWSKRIDFGGPPAWNVGMTFVGLAGRADRILEWKDPVVVEALGDDGKSLPQSSYRDPSVFLAQDEREPRDSIYTVRAFSMAVRAPEETKSFKRLKVSVTARVAVKCTRLELALEGRDKPCKAESGEWRVEMVAVEPSPFGHGRIRIRLRRQDLSSEALIKRPFLAEAQWTDRMEHAFTTRLRIVKDDVEAWVSYFPPRRDNESVTGWIPNKVRLLVADEIEERRIFAEFQDVPLQ